MKTLLGVTGIGLGHATRSHAVFDELKRRKSRTKVVSWGEAVKYYKKNKVNVSEIPGYTYRGYDFNFDVLYNVLESFKEPGKLNKGYKSFKRHAKDFKPDIIFSDSEPNSFFYAYKHSIPNYTLLNLVSTINNFKSIPKKFVTRQLKLQRLMVERLVSFMMKKGDRFYVPAFERRVKYMEKVKFIDLIVRKNYSELPNITDIREKYELPENFYYVHVGGAEIEQPLFKVLRKTLPKFKDKFFVVSSNYQTKKVIEEKNMRIYPFVNNAMEFVKACDGIVSPAGHSGMSEAIVYKKPMMVIPIKNHIEQLVNAVLLKKEGFGEACMLDRNISVPILKLHLDNFFSKEDKYKDNLRDAGFRGKGAEQIARDMLK